MGATAGLIDSLLNPTLFETDSWVNHPIGGSGLRLCASTLDGGIAVRRAIDAGNLGTVKMRVNYHDSCRRAGTGQTARAAPPVFTAEQRATLRQGPRIRAKIIARAHLRRQAAQYGPMPGARNRPCSRAPIHGPPPQGEAGA